MKRVVKAAGIAVLLAAAGSVSACQTEMMSDDRIVSNTAGVLGVSPDELTISERRSDGATNTYYIAVTRSGRKYACTINGGGLLAMGLVNPPTCNPMERR